MLDGKETPSRPQLTEISNTAVALHREHFGRGPGAAKTHIADNLVVCVLTDVFTPFEKTLIEAGEEDRVRETRAIHRTATENVYKSRMEVVMGRQVEAHLNSIHVDPDVAVDIFVLGGEIVAGADGAVHDGAAPDHDGAAPDHDGAGTA